MTALKIAHQNCKLSDLSEILLDYSTLFPNKVVLTSYSGSTANYADLILYSDKVSQFLYSRGYQSWHRVGILFEDRFNYSAVLLGALCDFVVVPMNSSLSTESLEEIINQSEIDVIVCDQNSSEMCRELKASQHSFNIVTAEIDSVKKDIFLSIVGQESPIREAKREKINSPGLLFQSADSVAKAKWIYLTQSQLIFSAEQTSKQLDLNEEDLCLSYYPGDNFKEVLHGLLTAVVSRSGNLFIKEYSDSAIIDSIKSKKLTWMSTTTFQCETWANRYCEPEDLFDKLRFVRIDGFPLKTDLLNKLMQLFKTSFVQAYGKDESAGLISSTKPCRDENILRTVGEPLGTDVKIYQEGVGIISNNEKGEVLVKSPAVFSGCAFSDELDSNCSPFGWLKTGDEGYFDNTGRLCIAGKLHETIKRGGVTISLSEIETVLVSDLSIQSAVAFGMPDANYGEVVNAAIVLKIGEKRSPEEILYRAAAILSTFKVPQKVYVLSKIPCNLNKEVTRKDLAEYFQKHQITHHSINTSIKSDVEEAIANWFSHFSGVPFYDINANCFGAGVNSDIAVSIVFAVNQKYQLNVSCDDLYRYPTVREFSLFVFDLLQRKLSL